jgi:very-short-patch-repair endonuclease
MTPQEVKLWIHLRSWRSRGFHFRRQSPRRGYIVDFVCMKYRLIVEVDGGQHSLETHHMQDRRRDVTLEGSGFRVLRFWNSDVDNNLSGVLQSIDDTLAEMSPHPPPSGEG